MPVAWLVFKQELVELWLGRRALNLLILFSVLMSITAFLLATNNEVNLLPLSHTVMVALSAAISFGLFNGLIISAESISGERERATLEALLLTPASRRRIIVGKFLAALTPWPVTLVLSAPYIAVLSRGDPIMSVALFWGLVVGTLVAVSFACVGMLLSILSKSSRVSLAVGILIYALALVPAQLPSEFQATAAGTFIAAVNPLESARQFLQRTLVEGQTLREASWYLLSSAAFTAVLLALLFSFAAPRVGVEGGLAGIGWRRGRGAEATK